MKDYQYTVVIEPDGDQFHAFVPALPGCHTFGPSIEEAQANILEAIQLHLECMRQDNEEIPVEGQPSFITRLTIAV